MRTQICNVYLHLDIYDLHISTVFNVYWMWTWCISSSPNLRSLPNDCGVPVFLIVARQGDLSKTVRFGALINSYGFHLHLYNRILPLFPFMLLINQEHLNLSA